MKKIILSIVILFTIALNAQVAIGKQSVTNTAVSLEFSDSEKPRVRAIVILEPSYSPKAAENRKAAKKTQQRGRRRRSRMPGKLQHEQSLTIKVTNTKQAARDGSRSPGPRAATRRRRGAARLRLQ